MLREGNGFQIREYAPFALAVADVDVERAPRGAAGELVAGGRSFTALTSYLFGGNGRGETMAMTTPVFVDVSPAEGVVGAPRAILSAQFPSARNSLTAHPSMPTGRTPGSRRMGFFVPSPYDDAGAAPPPADGSGVAVVQAEARTLAVCTSFAGYATDGECARQLEKLLAALARDGVASADGAAGKYSVLQYNPPQTLPFLRRNEVAVAVDAPEAAAPTTAAARRDAAAAEEAALAEAAAAEAAAAAAEAEEEAEAPGDVEMEVEVEVVAEPEEAPVDVEMAEEVSSDVDDDFIEGDLV